MGKAQQSRYWGLRFILSMLATFGLNMLGASTAQADAEATMRYALCDTYCVLVDADGKLIVPRVFNHLKSFNDPINTYRYDSAQGEKTGVINRDGKRILRPVYDNNDLLILAGHYIIIHEGATKERKQSQSQNKHPEERYRVLDATGRKIISVVDNSTVKFRVWGNHLFYGNSDKCKSVTECPSVVIDDNGRVLASFPGFTPYEEEPLLMVCIEKDHCGIIDKSLNFVVPPKYKYVSLFNTDTTLFLFANDKGQYGILDAHGREIVPAGRYSLIYNQPTGSKEIPILLEAYRADQKNCPVYLGLDGAELAVPVGFCATSLSMALGIDDAQGHLGTIDTQGRILIEPKYPWLKPLGQNYFEFGNDARSPTQFGIMDRQGKILIPAQAAKFSGFQQGLDGAFVAGQIEKISEFGDKIYRVGVMGLDGEWRVPPKYRQAKVLSPHLVALETKESRSYLFFNAEGKQLPVTSIYETYSLPTSDYEPGWDFRNHPDEPARPFRFYVRNTQGGSLVGLFDGEGNIILPAEYKDIKPLGPNIIAAGKYVSQGPDQMAQEQYMLFDWQGHRLGHEVFSMEDNTSYGYKNGRAVLQTIDYQQVLVDKEGHILANAHDLVQSLIHQNPNQSADSRVESSLDICYVSNPAIEPEDRPIVSRLARRICANPQLRAQSRETEKLYYAVQTGDCLPDEFEALRPGYDRALAACADDACVTKTMQAFRTALEKTAKQCSAKRTPGIEQNPHVPKALFERVRRTVMSNSPEADQNRVSISGLKLAGKPAVLASDDSGAHNNQFWLYLKTANDWRMVLSDYSGYLRGIELTKALRHGLPILRTQQHASCCEHDVTYFAYNGRDYKPIQECTQLYDQDETPLLFCGAKRKTTP